MSAEYADTVIAAGRVRTMAEAHNGGDPDAIAIAAGRVLGVGTREELEAFVGPETRVLQFPGSTVVPGLTDAHMHPIYSLTVARGLSLVDITSYDELESALRAGDPEQEGQEWFFAWGLDPNAFEGRPLDHRLLHEIFGEDRPVYVKTFDAHCAIASRAALDRAGIDRPFTDDDGAAAVDDGTGKPSGLLLEFPAMDRVEAVAPSPVFAERVELLRKLLGKMAARGITAAHVMDLKDDDALDLLRSIESDGHLPVRLRISPWCEPSTTDEEFERLLALQGTGGRRFTVEGIKFFIDGTVEGGTAWLDAPDIDGCGTASTWSDAEAYRERVRAFHERGVPTATHAIGERGIRFVAETLAALPAGGPQHRIEHLESADDASIALMAERGISASMQPTHCTHYVRADGLDDWSRRLGPERASRAWRTGDIRRAGIVLALGSDWPVAAYDPWEIMADARLRRPVGSDALEPVGADQMLSAVEAIEGYTTHAHRSIGREGGTLEAGRPADLVVIDVDPLTASPEEMAGTRVLLTMVDGLEVGAPQRG